MRMVAMTVTFVIMHECGGVAPHYCTKDVKACMTTDNTTNNNNEKDTANYTIHWENDGTGLHGYKKDNCNDTNKAQTTALAEATC